MIARLDMPAWDPRINRSLFQATAITADFVDGRGSGKGDRRSRRTGSALHTQEGAKRFFSVSLWFNNSYLLCASVPLWFALPIRRRARPVSPRGIHSWTNTLLGGMISWKVLAYGVGSSKAARAQERWKHGMG